MFNIFKFKSTKVDKTANAVNQLKVYWTGSTWAFDDPSVGLVAEPFVAGADMIISDAIQEKHGYLVLKKAKENGIVITFSKTMLPYVEDEVSITLQEQFDKLGHGMYTDIFSGRVGWLCPATLHYFKDYPEYIYANIKVLL
jgi:hypothetical protein